jgi:opacity protein-like surface antigen
MRGSERTRGWLVRGLLALATIAVSASSSRAQAGAVSFGGGMAWSFPVDEFEELYNDGPGYRALFGVNLLHNLELQLALGQSMHDQRREAPSGSFFDFGDGFDFTVTTLSAGPRVFFLDPDRVFRPFVAGGLGYARVEADDASPDNAVFDDDRFEFNLGGGFDLGQPRWAFTFEARYRRVVASGDDEDLPYVVPFIGFTYRLLPYAP